jgi:hypothetical protein
MKVLKELKDMKAGSTAPSIWRPGEAGRERAERS